LLLLQAAPECPVHFVGLQPLLASRRVDQTPSA